jgi:hypothetical protein
MNTIKAVLKEVESLAVEAPTFDRTGCLAGYAVASVLISRCHRDMEQSDIPGVRAVRDRFYQLQTHLPGLFQVAPSLGYSQAQSARLIHEEVAAIRKELGIEPALPGGGARKRARK